MKRTAAAGRGCQHRGHESTATVLLLAIFSHVTVIHDVWVCSPLWATFGLMGSVLASESHNTTLRKALLMTLSPHWNIPWKCCRLLFSVWKCEQNHLLTSLENTNREMEKQTPVKYYFIKSWTLKNSYFRTMWVWFDLTVPFTDGNISNRLATVIRFWQTHTKNAKFLLVHGHISFFQQNHFKPVWRAAQADIS